MILRHLLSIIVLLSTVSFVATFDGHPAAPASYTNPDNWDIMVFGVDSRQPNLAQHGPNCEAPGFPYTPENTHPFSTPAQATFICNDHLMTSLGVTGYGAVYMTPPAVADFSQGPVRIAWDMSTLRTSSRDWIYVTITPFMEHHEAPFINTDQHIPPHHIRILLGGADTLLVYQNDPFNHAQMDDDFTTWDDVFRANGVTQSPTRRDTFEVTLDRNRISLCMPNYTYHGQQPFCWTRNTPLRQPLDPNVWHDQASVQFTHVTYNAEKACNEEPGAPMPWLDSHGINHNAYGDLHCPPNTWHWDNISISPFVPYGVIPSPSETSSGSPFTASFPAPAPANSYLSFYSQGNTPDLRVSYDAGATWLQPLFQQSTSFNSLQAGENILMPIPGGQTSVMVRGTQGWWGTYSSFAFKVITPPGEEILPLPTPLPTLTSTVTPGPVGTPTPTVASTPQPTPTPVPVSPTPTAQALVCSLSIQNGVVTGTCQ